MSPESQPYAPGESSTYEGIPHAWFDSTGSARELRQFRPPYAFNDMWEEIVTNIGPHDCRVGAGQYPVQAWRTENTVWPRRYDITSHLVASLQEDETRQHLTVYWNNAYYHDVMDTLEEVPGTSILKAIVDATAYRAYHQDWPRHSAVELNVSRQRVLPEDAPLKKQMNRYRKRENVPCNTLSLPLSPVHYVWTPQRDAFLADYSFRRRLIGTPAEVMTDEFFDIARAITALMRSKRILSINEFNREVLPLYTYAV